MVAYGWKTVALVWAVGLALMAVIFFLFTKDDPDQLHDLAADASYYTQLQIFEQLLRQKLDPQLVDRKAKDDQNALVARFGGRHRAMQTGPVGATPAPAS